MGKAWKLQLYQQLSRMERPKAKEKTRKGQKKRIERMEAATFSCDILSIENCIQACHLFECNNW